MMNTTMRYRLLMMDVTAVDKIETKYSDILDDFARDIKYLGTQEEARENYMKARQKAESRLVELDGSNVKFASVDYDNKWLVLHLKNGEEEIWTVK